MIQCNLVCHRGIYQFSIYNMVILTAPETHIVQNYTLTVSFGDIRHEGTQVLLGHRSYY